MSLLKYAIFGVIAALLLQHFYGNLPVISLLLVPALYWIAGVIAFICLLLFLMDIADKFGS